VPQKPDRSANWLVWKDVVVDGRKAVYGEAGTGAPVLFLHGWGLDHKAYKRALSRLGAVGLRGMAPTLAGFGGTPAMHDHNCTIGSYGAWLARFVEAVGVHEPVLVIGHSFGGGVGISLACDYPDKVRGLVLVNSIGASAWSRHGSVVYSMAQRPLWDWGLHFPADLWPLGQARRVLPVIVAEALPNIRHEPLAFWRSAQLARCADLTPQLETLKHRGLPIVVLWGSRDRIITRVAFDQMCDLLGKPDTVTVEGSHSWLIADPDAFGEVMTNVIGVAAMAQALPGSKRNADHEVNSLLTGERARRRAS